MSYCRTIGLACLSLFTVFDSFAAPAGDRPDFTRDKVFYVVPYSHLDTQWRWDYPSVINEDLKKTITPNFALMEKYPGYVFNFAGTWRYELMKEYYPEQWETLKKYVAQGQWHPAGAMVEETDALVPSPESLIRNILYGNQWLKREFGFENRDYLLPDCFGFLASMPSVLAHCGLKGFSTQKLSWGSAVGIPFNVGVWEGPDGKSVVAALNATPYNSKFPADFATDPKWVTRMEASGRKSGLFVDYRYFGVGDRGGACREEDVKNLEQALKTPGQFRIVAATSGRLYDDLSDTQRDMLPKYQGDLLLTQHSAGSLTSMAYMKRCNRKGELLADAAERADVLAAWMGAMPYPFESLRAGWGRLLASQFHDNLPGTSLPQCYDYCFNDDFIALKGFAANLADGVSAVASQLKTDGCKGVPVVVFNPLGLEREDLVEMKIDGIRNPAIYDASGLRRACQPLSDGTLLVSVKTPSVGFTVLDVRDEDTAAVIASELTVTERTLENGRYKVLVNNDGDIASVYDKQLKRELLSAPAQIQFLHEKPKEWPAWNMDWMDRTNSPEAVLAGPAKIRIAERGPVRVALEVERSARNSRFVQTIRLAAGPAGERLEIATSVDWRGQECSVKHAFPLASSNALASYNLGVGTIQRGNNNPHCYEMPSREWIDLTDASGTFGVSVLEDCKYGSDKPTNNVLRLTLLFTPGVREKFKDQQWQDWGRHEMTYALYGHAGDGRNGQSEWAGQRLNQPLRAFIASRHDGWLASGESLVAVNDPQIAIRAVKMAEDGQAVIVRLQELAGTESAPVTLSFGRGIECGWEVDGQERRIEPAVVLRDKLCLGAFPRYALRSFALVPNKVRAAEAVASRSCALDTLFNVDVISTDGNRRDGDFSGGLTLPAEQLPARLISGGVDFELGSGMTAGMRNAIACRGQAVALPPGNWNEVALLVAAETDLTVGINGTEQFVPAWNKPVGNWDQRQWTGEMGNAYRFDKTLTGLVPGYTKPGRIAWFATHHHSPRGNEAYQFCYLYHVEVPVSRGGGSLVLPDDPRLKVFAMSAVNRPVPPVKPAAPLHDDLSACSGDLSLPVGF